MSTSKCNKCEAIFVDNNNVIKCFGGCNRMFHFGCSSLSNANAKLCNNNPNIKFLCADCLNSHSNHQQLIQSLMVQLNEFSNLLTNLFANFQAVSNLIVCPTNTAATLRSNTFVNNNSQDAVISGTDSSNTQLEIVKPKKYLHVILSHRLLARTSKNTSIINYKFQSRILSVTNWYQKGWIEVY